MKVGNPLGQSPGTGTDGEDVEERCVAKAELIELGERVDVSGG